MFVDLIKIVVKKECVSDAEVLLKAQATRTRMDEGCIQCNILQSKTDPAAFYMMLEWESVEAIEKHLATKHDLEFRNNMEDKMAAPIEMFDWNLIS